MDDEDRTAKAGLGSAWLLEIGPPHLTTLDYHSAELTLRAWAARNAASIPLGSSAKTSVQSARHILIAVLGQVLRNGRCVEFTSGQP